MSLLRHIFGLIRPRRRSSVWLPPGYDPTHTLFTATPGYVYSDTAGTVLLTAAGNARSWRARNGTLAVSNENVAWDGVDTLTYPGSTKFIVNQGLTVSDDPVTMLVVAQLASTVRAPLLLNTLIGIEATGYSHPGNWGAYVTHGISTGTTPVIPLTLNRSVVQLSLTSTAVGSVPSAVGRLRVNGVDNPLSSTAPLVAHTSTALGIGGFPTISQFICPNGTKISAAYLIPATAADATRRAALEASFMSYFNVGLSIT